MNKVTNYTFHELDWKDPCYKWKIDPFEVLLASDCLFDKGGRFETTFHLVLLSNSIWNFYTNCIVSFAHKTWVVYAYQCWTSRVTYVSIALSYLSEIWWKRGYFLRSTVSNQNGWKIRMWRTFIFIKPQPNDRLFSLGLRVTQIITEVPLSYSDNVIFGQKYLIFVSSNNNNSSKRSDVF